MSRVLIICPKLVGDQWREELKVKFGIESQVVTGSDLEAKQEKKFRFYLLYDKVYRLDILGHAYDLVRENKGTAGVDGITFESIEGTEGGAQEYLENLAREFRTKTYKPVPVRRVYIPKADGGKRPLGIPTIKDRIVQMATKIVIEPIFEADFQENSYGFRPKRSAHQAVDDITKHLRAGRTEVIDADISKYFDTIPHDKLLTEVAKRIVDKNILKLIKMWLTASVVEEDEDGKKKYRPNDKGTPQGGVISPLLANIYLNILDTLWKAKRIQEEYGARLVRYADDFVVLCRSNTERVRQGIEKVLVHLGLCLNEQNQNSGCQRGKLQLSGVHNKAHQKHEDRQSLCPCCVFRRFRPPIPG